MENFAYRNDLFQSCEQGTWVEHADSQVVQTCWATMALMYAQYPNPEPVERAVKLVMSRQLPVRLSHQLVVSYVHICRL